MHAPRRRNVSVVMSKTCFLFFLLLCSRFRAEAPSLTDERTIGRVVCRACSLTPPSSPPLSLFHSSREWWRGRKGKRRRRRKRWCCWSVATRRKKSGGESALPKGSRAEEKQQWKQGGGKGGRGAPPNALETDKKGEGGECGEKMRTNAPSPLSQT